MGQVYRFGFGKGGGGGRRGSFDSGSVGRSSVLALVRRPNNF